MSDHFQMLVDEEVSLVDAPAVCADVVAALRDRELIIGDLTPDCVLGGMGYRLGPAVPAIYTLTANQSPFWTLVTSGVEPSVKRSFNCWALGESCGDFVCPQCHQKHDGFDSPIRDAVVEVVGNWCEQNGDTEVLCTACGKATRITEWGLQPPLGFGNLSFTFWNWPPFDLPAWKLDVPALVKEITGHNIVISWGHI